jgi:hypothetical protein
MHQWLYYAIVSLGFLDRRVLLDQGSGGLFYAAVAPLIGVHTLVMLRRAYTRGCHRL